MEGPKRAVWCTDLDRSVVAGLGEERGAIIDILYVHSNNSSTAQGR